MEITLSPIKTDEQLKDLETFATGIWLEYWPALIGDDQTRYMIDMFHSFDAMKRDMSEKGYEYWFVEDTAGKVVGYTGGHVEPETNRFFISKIYLLKEERGKHYASKILNFYEELCANRGLEAMYLTVNKHNDLGIRSYLGRGFATIEEVETDIGSGYIMDDYIMEKRF